MVIIVLVGLPFFSPSDVSSCTYKTHSLQAVWVEAHDFSPKETPAIPQLPPILLVGLLLYDEQAGAAFPWRPKVRFKKWALARYRQAKQAFRQRYWRARLASLLLRGTLPMASVVDLLPKNNFSAIWEPYQFYILCLRS